MRRAGRFVLAALLALAPAVANAQDDAIGLRTLFHSHEERERLDRLRRGEAVRSPAAGADAQAAERPAITGYVKRSDERHTVWIDGAPVPVAGARGRALLDPRRLEHLAPPPGTNDIEIKRSR